MTLVTVNDKSYYLEECLKRALDKIKHKVEKTDNDIVLVVDGNEGSGKSVFAMQIAHYLDNTLNLDRICMNAEEFKQAIMNAEKHQAIIFDEAYTGLSSRASLTAVNRIIVGKMMEMRQKNLFVIIVLPSFFLLDRYVALFRSKILFHIYVNKGKRYWLGFNSKNKKLLYILGRKLMSYSKPRIHNFKGHFFGKYVLDEEQYRLKKKMALESSEKETEGAKKDNRDALIINLWKEGLDKKKISELLGISVRLVQYVVKKYRENHENEG